MAKGKARVRTVQVSLRMPIGVYEEMTTLMDELKYWARPQPFIFEAIHEKVKRHRDRAREERAAEAENKEGKG